jgi:hypothetical protein
MVWKFIFGALAQTAVLCVTLYVAVLPFVAVIVAGVSNNATIALVANVLGFKVHAPRWLISHGQFFALTVSDKMSGTLLTPMVTALGLEAPVITPVLSLVLSAAAFVFTFGVVMGPMAAIAAGSDGKFGMNTAASPALGVFARALRAVEHIQRIPAPLTWFCMEFPAFAAFMLFNFCPVTVALDDTTTTLTAHVLTAAAHSEAGTILAPLSGIWRNPATILFAAHYFHRSIIFPLRIWAGTAGQAAPFPSYAVIMGSVFCSVNGLAQNGAASSVTKTLYEVVPGNLLPYAILFVACMWWNAAADAYLLYLKRMSKGYAIPMESEVESRRLPARFRGAVGAMFRRVDFPHYFFEICEWCVFFCASVHLSLGRPPLLRNITIWSAGAFAFTSVCILLGKGLPRHLWYINTFGGRYQKLGRKALIPFII